MRIWQKRVVKTKINNKLKLERDIMQKCRSKMRWIQSQIPTYVGKRSECEILDTTGRDDSVAMLIRNGYAVMEMDVIPDMDVISYVKEERGSDMKG